MGTNTILETTTNSPAATEKAAFDFAKNYLSDESYPRFLAMYGDLGVGKTAFVRGLAEALTPGAEVNSPTYKLVNVYRAENGKPNLCHFDMYRISDEDDLYSIGFYDYMDSGDILTIEWSEKIEFALPDDYFRITLKKVTYDTSSPDADSRTITIQRVQNQ